MEFLKSILIEIVKIGKKRENLEIFRKITQFFPIRKIKVQSISQMAGDMD